MRTALANRQILVCDGAMGTMLHAAGNSLDQALPALNLSNAALVRAIHDSYISAGVDIIQTNTFGASRLRLSEHGFGDRAGDINRAGVRIARQAVPAGSGVLVAGSVSPTVTVQQRRQASPPERTAALREQIEALARVDIILLETFGYLDELVEAIEVATAVTRIPVMAQATFGADARTLSGHTPREVAGAVAGAPIVSLGTNCTLGPQRSLVVLRELREHSDLPLTVQPNAGLPRRVAPARLNTTSTRSTSPGTCASCSRPGRLSWAGAAGPPPRSLPRPWRSPAATGSGWPRTRDFPRTASSPRPARPPGSRSPPGRRPRRRRADHAGDRGRGRDPRDGARAGRSRREPRLRRRGPHQPGPGQRLDLALHLHQGAGDETIASVTTWDRTIMALQADLLGAHALGLRRIICGTGTRPCSATTPTWTASGMWIPSA